MTKQKIEFSSIEEIKKRMFAEALYLHASPGVGKTLAYLQYLGACGLKASEAFGALPFPPPPSIFSHMHRYADGAEKKLLILDTDMIMQPPPFLFLEKTYFPSTAAKLEKSVKEPWLFQAPFYVYGPITLEALNNGVLPVLLTNLWPRDWVRGFRYQAHFYMADSAVDAFFPARSAEGSTTSEKIKEWNHKIEGADLPNKKEIHAPWELNNFLVTLAECLSSGSASQGAGHE